MKSLNEIWQEVAKRAPKPRRQLLPRLKAFLLKLDNPHARWLTGRLNTDPGDQTSALQLQAWVVGKYRDQGLSKSDVAEWLRLIYDLISVYNSERPALFPTQLLDFVAPSESVFSPDAVTRGLRVDRWKDGLHRWVGRGNDQTDPRDWVAAAVLSALLHGMLLDTVKLTQLVTKLSHKQRPDVTGDISSYVFDLPFMGMGNHHMQRWFLDPLSEMLIWRLLKAEFTVSANSLAKNVTRFLLSQGVRGSDCPDGLSDLVSTTKTWWAERTAPIDLNCASRSILTHAVHERSWARLHEQTYQPRANRPNKSREDGDIQSDTFSLDDLRLLNPWLDKAVAALTSDDRSTVQSEVAAIHSDPSLTPQAMVFVGWLHAMLQGFSAAKEALALSTIQRRFRAAAPRLLSLLGDQNPADMTTEQLEDYYSELTLDNEPTVPVRDIANGLRDFHAYLHKSCGKALMRKEAEVLGDENALKPVDANLISFDDYLRAQEWLDRQRGNKQERQISKLVLMLAFKVGLRRMEIFGLEIRDVQLHTQPVCVIRPNQKRRLKTTSSKRLIPLWPFLSQADRLLLADWMRHRMAQIGPIERPSTCDAYVFPQVGQAKHATWVDRITDMVCAALRAVTKDQQLFIHHLRHSFGTWTYLRLRAPDFPQISKHFKAMPATVKAIEDGGKLRALLIGRNPDVYRAYAFAVSRLLGHSSPMVSLGHYIHSADLLIGEVAHRECEKLPKAILIAASGLQKSAAYLYLSESMDRLVAANRRANQTHDPQPTAPEEPKTRGRKPSDPAHLKSEWLPLASVQQVLDMSFDGESDDSHIAKATRTSKAQIQMIRAEASSLGPLMGLRVDGNGNLIEGLLPTRGKDAKAFSERIEVLLADMSTRAPELYRRGLDIFLKHYDKEKRDAVFRDEKDLKDLKLLLRFLNSLGVRATEFSWMVRVLDTSAPTLPDWARKLGAKWAPTQIRAIRPKAMGGAASYAKWLGIFPIDSEGQSLGLVLSRTLFLARVSNASS